MIAMLKPEPGKTYCTCREAAKILGCTMGRVRQLARPSTEGGEAVLWSCKLGPRSMVFDLAQVKKIAKARQKAREAGIVPGPAPGGFDPDT